jgi:hypothetical protein
LGAFARKPTALAYRVSDSGEMYDEKGIEYYDQKFRLQRIKWHSHSGWRGLDVDKRR